VTPEKIRDFNLTFHGDPPEEMKIEAMKFKMLREIAAQLAEQNMISREILQLWIRCEERAARVKP
jgi:hypothetical protein